MFGTIRRHQTWLWVIIITITVVSFVIFGPTTTKMGDMLSGGGGNFGKLGGKPITQPQYIEANKEVRLAFFLENKQWPASDSSEVNRATYQRLFLIQKENDLGIKIGTDAVAAVARHMLGSGSLDEFSDKVLRQGGLDASDFDRYLRHELGMEQMAKLAGLSGQLVTPQEAETLYRLEHQDLETSMAYFSLSNYLATVQVTPDDVAKFYTNQMANYRLPDQVQVKYVKFPLTNFTAAAMASLTNLNQIVDNTVKQMGTNLYNGAKTSAESREAIRSTIIRRASVFEARKAAMVFAQELDNMTPRVADNIDKLAPSNNLTVSITAPFDRQYGPSLPGMVVSPDFTRKAFQLTTNDPFAGPIVPDEEHPADGVYVIALKDRVPSRVPPFQEIQAKVAADYRNGLAMQAAQQAAVKFYGAVTNGLANGKTFSALCAESGVKPESLPVFNLSTRSLSDPIEQKINFSMLKQIAFSTAPGKVGPPAGARDGAFVLYVKKALPVDETKMKQEFPSFLTMIRQSRQGDAFNQWFNVQLNHDADFLQVIKKLSEQNQGQSGNTRRPRS